MLQIAIIVFREILEISLILGILTAATKDIPGRAKWIISGLSLGVFASLLLALSADKISNSLDGMGQEFFNGLILISAAIMIGWTVIWMQKHAKSISGELRNLGNSVRDGKKPLYILLVVVFLSILRESAEIVLFTYSYYISGVSIIEIISGLIGGIIVGSAIGVALYLGIIKAAGKYFFMITSWLLIFFAAGIIMKGVGFWVNADILPPLGDPIFDISSILSEKSLLGMLLNMFFGYIDSPMGVQVIAYCLTLITLIIGLKLSKRSLSRS